MSAAFRAAQRADELLAQGDLEGSLLWDRILAAAEELRRDDGRQLGGGLGLGKLTD
jgi:hypothetical protein